MTISSVVDIVHGDLLNKPSINRVENIRIDAKKVKRGDLYISFFEDDIDTAIDNGAYGLIVSKKRDIADSEIAWIAVDDINNAILLLLRYVLIEKNIEFYHFEEPYFSISKKLLSKEKSIVFLENSAYNWLDNILENDNIRYCISDRINILRMLTSDVKKLSNVEKTSVLKESLFDMTLFYNDRHYNIKLSSRLKNHVCSIVDFSKRNSLSCCIDSYSDTDVFKAYYVNSNIQIVQKPSKRVVIFDKHYSDEYSQESIEYLKGLYKWAKVLYFSDYEKEGSLFFKDESELKNMLKKENFDIAFVEFKTEIAIDNFFAPGQTQESVSTLF